VEAAAAPSRLPDASGPWQVSKLYYSTGFNRCRVEAIHAACVEEGIESPFADWVANWDPADADRTTTSVEVSDFLAQRTQALIAHATQIDPAARPLISGDIRWHGGVSGNAQKPAGGRQEAVICTHNAPIVRRPIYTQPNRGHAAPPARPRHRPPRFGRVALMVYPPICERRLMAAGSGTL
jgi:hypothetical protein